MNLSKFIDRQFFKDRLVSVLAGWSLLAGIFGVVRVLLGVSQYDFKITVRYTENGPDPFKLGDWYTLYELAFFIGITSIVAVALSVRLHKVNRTLALSVLLGYQVILIFFFLVSNAILGTSPVTS